MPKESISALDDSRIKTRRQLKTHSLSLSPDHFTASRGKERKTAGKAKVDSCRRLTPIPSNVTSPSESAIIRSYAYLPSSHSHSLSLLSSFIILSLSSWAQKQFLAAGRGENGAAIAEVEKEIERRLLGVSQETAGSSVSRRRRESFQPRCPLFRFAPSARARVVFHLFLSSLSAGRTLIACTLDPFGIVEKGLCFDRMHFSASKGPLQVRERKEFPEEERSARGVKEKSFREKGANRKKRNVLRLEE